MHVQTLVNWWSDYPEDLLTQRVLQPLQKYLTTELVVTKKLTVSVMNTIKVRWRCVLRPKLYLRASSEECTAQE